MSNVFMLGAIAMACGASALFFLRFWKETKDRLFLMFAFAFTLEGANRALLAYSIQEQTLKASEASPSLYLLRLLAYVLILVGIIGKNLESKP